MQGIDSSLSANALLMALIAEALMNGSSSGAVIPPMTNLNSPVLFLSCSCIQSEFQVRNFCFRMMLVFCKTFTPKAVRRHALGVN